MKKSYTGCHQPSLDDGRYGNVAAVCCCCCSKCCCVAAAVVAF